MALWSASPLPLMAFHSSFNGDRNTIISGALCRGDTPILHIRIDPDYFWLREVVFRQIDYMWCYQLQVERDPAAQIEVRAGRCGDRLHQGFTHTRCIHTQAIHALVDLPSPHTYKALRECVELQDCFFRVRMEAAMAIARVGVV